MPSSGPADHGIEPAAARGCGIIQISSFREKWRFPLASEDEFGRMPPVPPLFIPMQWMSENLEFLVPSPWREAVLGLLAVLAGLLIGNERTRKEKPAGIRTMALVCLGSATFTMIGYAFASKSGDSGRVAAQIVTGIGFLGGGVILRGPNSIFGATTAAMIWVTAAIGMVFGAGFPAAGFGVTVVVLSLLKFVGRWEHTHQGGVRSETVFVVFEPEHGKGLIKLEKLMVDYEITYPSTNLSLLSDGRNRLQIDYRLPMHRHVEFLNQLACMPEVTEIERQG
jgi:putative Mg2+ transporter-C (MgtC) family protein